ncbi:DMT family protein [Humisphaera borealis]|uniref:DMT family protein n=1 Tax=Humisphaera borealis TaxID=2807512 RepID=A0A7M2X387_9BACT|nr:DMT family protein [Humisphaera borealis]QOV91892.1 DMT family protein [Humisphaera borealis]
MKTILLLILSNVFMTFAWYGHLRWFPEAKDKPAPLFLVILLSWGIAFFEYCFQVPGNRIGRNHEGFTTGQLKVMQEIITLVVFVVFSWTFLKEPLAWNYFVAFGLMVAAAFFVFAV